MTLRNKTDTLAAILREHEAILREHEAILQEVSIAYDHITDHKAQVEAPHRKRTDDVTEPVTDPDRPTTMARIFLELEHGRGIQRDLEALADWFTDHPSTDHSIHTAVFGAAEIEPTEAQP